MSRYHTESKKTENEEQNKPKWVETIDVESGTKLEETV